MIADALAPVSDALSRTARARAATVLERAERDASALLARARSEAGSLLERARDEGEEAADQIAASQLAAARRQAHETVLAARRRAYDELRTRAVEALVQESATPRGQNLVRRLSLLVGERLGEASTPTEHGPFVLEASFDGRSCRIGPEALIDQALLTMADAVEALWR